MSAAIAATFFACSLRSGQWTPIPGSRRCRRASVQPAEQDDEIAGLLEGVPLPPDFDRSTVEPAKLPQDRYQLTYFVMSGVYCSWLDRWWFAQKAGDEATAAEAIEVLKASPRWPAVAKASKNGSIGGDFREYAKTVATGYGDKQVYDQMMNCIEY